MKPVSTLQPTLQESRMRCMELWGGNRAAFQHLTLPGLEVWVYSQPTLRDEGGGDVYYLSSCASGRISRLLLADVSGHDERAARVALGLRDLMRQHVNMVQQTRLVAELNQQFQDVSRQGEFATALVCTFFLPRRSFSVCSAGHPDPLLYRCRDGSWTQLHEGPADPEQGISNTPLGVVERAEYRQADTRLETGDMVLAYTDGLTETRLDDGNMLRTAGLLEAVRKLNVDRPEGLIRQLLSTLEAAGGRPAADDDVSILLCRATGTGVGWRNNLLALFRLLGGVRDVTNWKWPSR